MTFTAKSLSGLSALILAGGESRRMGRDKAWVELGGTPLIALAVNLVRGLGVTDVLISGRAGRDYSALGCRVVLDTRPGLGPMSGIERGLAECSNPLLLVIAVDLPYLTLGLLRALWESCGPGRGTLPIVNSKPEPVAAIYPKSCHPLALEMLESPHRAVRAFSEACRTAGAVTMFQVQDADASAFRNCNTPSDLLV